MSNIAIFGYGIVGKGVFDILKNNPEIKVRKVFDREKKREELGDLLETDMEKIFSDENIDTIVECMGGDEVPYQVITSALMHHKNVVSSNKETLSRHLEKYLQLANENHVSIQFESSVGGGIPLIYPLTIQAQFDQILSVKGILNATCNFVLTKMQKEGMTLKDAVKLAQENGFAEKDPSADLKGLDMVRKGNVIARVVTGREIHNEEVPHFGIEHVSLPIIDIIKRKNRQLRFIVEIDLRDGISMAVLPIAITSKSPLIHVEYENNGILIEGKNNGPITLLGKGAGRYPTASAILQDLIRLEKGIAYPYRPLLPYQKIKPTLMGRFYAFQNDTLIKELSNPSQEELKQYDFVCRKDQ